MQLPLQILFSLTLFIISISAFVTEVKARDKACFFETLKKGDKMGVNFQVEHGGNLDIDLKINGPFDELIHAEYKQYAAGFHFVAENDGKHTYCFFNEQASNGDKRVSFSVSGAPYFGKLNPDKKDSKDDLLNPLDREIRELTHGLRTIKDEQMYIVARERAHRDTAESTNSRVLWWSIFQLGMLIGVCYWQIYYLKQFFEVKLNKPQSYFAFMTKEPAVEFQEGDHVVYRPVGQAMQISTGVIKKILTEKQESEYRNINASEEEPRFVIENDHTHKETAYKLENLLDYAENIENYREQY
ncbi:hypothetical protein ROZALSC1DRAFT_30800 [Rozella allomycis CSF55]|uniref:GOLD domain-containing protein n=1 Tax=Rozella allomycis (strain CSF55) TaxID=988480 RepID=A0A075B258_ROZAC|nr:GOLD domain-containing protein [Rozella allomycis CSF55]RKP17389.1 hypothetical protein ROZALSC1DRAFT_30800 [Rozella allomycis CSF55]|eukprot:EPZ36590.1 GOLD domain-containing protein [Rozella allomycis CSF55]